MNSSLRNYFSPRKPKIEKTGEFLFNSHPAELIYLNFQPLEVVSRYHDPQPQVVENYSYLFNLIYQTCTNLDV